MSERRIVILGAGMAGFGAAHRLGQEGIRPVLYEAGPWIGGHTATHAYPDGFAFDEGPHVSFTANERLQALFARAVDGRFERVQAYVNNHWRGHWFKHPVQVNLHGLPADLVARCIADFVAASRATGPAAANYEEWLRATFGHTIAEVFPMPYARKYHTTEAANLTTDWLGPRIYRPSIEEVLRGAREAEPLDVHYVDRFRYPTEGGFGAYLAPLRDLAECRCGHRVAAIDPVAKVLTFADGTAAPYGALVTSFPLPVLVPM
ncbi:MAG: NAD(P)-binding protein, partial [Alphaproteobacteria bacterium]